MSRFLLLAFTAVFLSPIAGFANEDFDQLMEKGWDEWDQENYKEAIKLCSDAIDIEPNDPEGYYCRGTALSEMGKPRTAYKDFTKAIELDPDDLDYYYWRGVTIMTMTRQAMSRMQKVGCSDLKKAYSNKHDFTLEYVQENKDFLRQECPFLF
ncbi:tetratricopeptide repeat protein [Prochlorococcus marinus]|uniref:tetratricopeptide repeat protein n=1 Tax=Prochlorococcus marinus TaxID=1219 RepID=UPI0022B2EFFA|nr:tetratricopeptide repeat protein [Prochlorococcus marinus]